MRNNSDLLKFVDNLVTDNKRKIYDAWEISTELLSQDDLEEFAGMIMKQEPYEAEFLINADVISIVSSILTTWRERKQFFKDELVNSLSKEAISYYRKYMNQLLNERLPYVLYEEEWEARSIKQSSYSKECYL